MENGIYAKIATPKGAITIKLEHEKTPMTVANFVGLAEGTLENNVTEMGTPYYDGLTFHRVIADFMVQGGDPTGTGAGGPGYQFEDEIHPELTHNRPERCLWQMPDLEQTVLNFSLHIAQRIG